ncbi:hypothetical protein JR316_0008300 [Psilocybe cubensis]|uniref:DUF6593 domain-containing protein n=2 Tax=Psilocybe cubensis TaxID=181762 RepID=A0A8H7XRX4_PSICU|nr:hypothetical protein JR316_0008300 [Psilocybe cubensis]KAH9479705.1 hypothetical protein JR316_0008300 [Psilocybe cubensis]
MPLFSSYRRSRQPEDSLQLSLPPTQASSSSSLTTYVQDPMPPAEIQIPTSAEVTMTWNTDALNEGQQITISMGQGQEEQLVLENTVDEPPSPIEPPPDYDVARIPTYPVVYTFSSLGPSSSAMILVPTQDSPDTRPIYHISVGHDPFFPMSFITSVVRGGHAEGDYVGGFKTIQAYRMIGTNRWLPTPASETVTIRGFEYPMPGLFVKNNKNGLKHFQWGNKLKEQYRLTWACPAFPGARVYTCYKQGHETQPLAKFTPTNELLRRNTPFPEAKLEIMPIGHGLFDDILISVLLLERMRRVTYNSMGS